MIIYTAFDYKAQIFSCMNYYIESMINDHYFDEDDNIMLYWENVWAEKDKLKTIT